MRNVAEWGEKCHVPGRGSGPMPHSSSPQAGQSMFAKINHVAIVSEKYALLASFYESLFGMKRSAKGKINRAITVGDGYAGLNINPRKAGRPGGLDHFGIEVEDIDTVFDRIRSKYPGADWVQRPSTRPFAGI